ncbi:MAG: XdhC/CoxI family protein [Myxococcota bacterium]|nr:XdhC/CoxI family protein [Myxococcota bacterium]
MREILPTLDRWLDTGEKIALATLVDTHGTTPRPAGARLCLTESGLMEGSISGGCIEGDVFTRGLQVLEESKAVLTRYGIESDVGVAVGLSCGGEVDVLIEPFQDDRVWRAVREAIENRRPAALCTTLAPEPWLGRRLAVLGDGQTEGGIEAEVDALLTQRAPDLWKDGGHEILETEISGEPVRVVIEAFAPPPRLYIVGATHIATILCPMASTLGFHVSVIDPRTPFATPSRFAQADQLILEWPQEFLAREELDDSAFVLTLTHDMKFDIPTLAHALRSEAGYVGALGSRRTHEKRLSELRAEGFDEVDLGRIHTPIGLNLGGRSPEEIALSILAEVVATRRGTAEQFSRAPITPSSVPKQTRT